MPVKRSRDCGEAKPAKRNRQNRIALLDSEPGSDSEDGALPGDSARAGGARSTYDYNLIAPNAALFLLAMFPKKVGKCSVFVAPFGREVMGMTFPNASRPCGREALGYDCRALCALAAAYAKLPS